MRQASDIRLQFLLNTTGSVSGGSKMNLHAKHFEQEGAQSGFVLSAWQRCGGWV